MIQDLPERNINEWVRKLAIENCVSDEPDKYSEMALKISSLSGDDINISLTQIRITNLQKKGILSKEDALKLLSMSIRENKLKQQ